MEGWKDGKLESWKAAAGGGVAGGSAARTRRAPLTLTVYESIRGDQRRSVRHYQKLESERSGYGRRISSRRGMTRRDVHREGYSERVVTQRPTSDVGGEYS